MKAAIIFVTLSVCAYMSLADDDHYPSTWDNVNVDEVLSNDRLISQYINCLKGKGKCSSDGAALKKFLPDALKTKCAKCTDKQKEGAAKVIKYMTEKKPDEWKELVAIFDPTGEYMKAYADELKKIA